MECLENKKPENFGGLSEGSNLEFAWRTEEKHDGPRPLYLVSETRPSIIWRRNYENFDREILF
jgi:hypothetical protein